MAARESNVIQGSLIVCVIILVLSLAGNFFMWQAADTAGSRASSASEQLQNAQNSIRNQDSQLQMLKAMIGVGEMSESEFEALQSQNADPEMQEIEQQFLQDMSLLPPDIDAQNRNYSALPRFLMTSVRQLNVDLAQSRAEVQALTAEKDEVIERETAAREAAEQARDDLADQLSQEKADYAADRARMNTEKEQLRDQLTNAIEKFNQERSKLVAERNQLTSTNEQLQLTIDLQRERIDELEEDEFETAQGEIAHVMPSANRVFINLGSRDQLRTGITFGVLDPEEVRVSSATPKAQIEVTAIRGEHLAEARVTHLEDLRNPITRNDKVYSPFWEPGRRVKIALAGLIDIDGDGRDDREQVRNMIRAAGAEVVAEVTEEGLQTGDLTFDTRFLVLGHQRDYRGGEDEARNERERRYQAAMGEVEAEAKQLGVTIISLNKLLGYLRSINDDVTVPLGTAASGSDFEFESAPGTSRRLPNDVSGLYDRDRDENAGAGRRRNRD